jgi:putative hemolysin
MMNNKYLFSYATASDPPLKRGIIRLVEKATGQPKLKQMYIANQRSPRANESFWQAAVRSLALDVRYYPDSLVAMPKTGPVVVVANHPYGVLDGIVISWLVSKVRSDFVVLTNAILMRAPEIQDFILPIDFSETDDARSTNLASRSAAREQLERGGVVVVFPAGAVSTAPDKLGLKPAIDARWQPFVSQLIQRSKATVVPIWFGGQNSRLFQIASHLSYTLRISLIFHEVRSRIGTCLPVVIGAPIPFAALPSVKDRQGLADKLRDQVYGLARLAPAIRKPPGPADKLLSPVRAVLKAQRAA